MILIDTPVLLAWLDPDHPEHDSCLKALDNCAACEQLAITTISLAMVAAHGRPRKSLTEDLCGFVRVATDEQAAIRAGSAYAATKKGKRELRRLSLLAFINLATAENLQIPILTTIDSPYKAFKRAQILLPEVKEPKKTVKTPRRRQKQNGKI